MEYESETTTVDMYGIKSKVKVDTVSLCTKAMVLDGSKLQFFGRVFVGQKNRICFAVYLVSSIYVLLV